MKRHALIFCVLTGAVAACSSDEGKSSVGTGDGGAGDAGEQVVTLPNPAIVVAVGGDGTVSIVDPGTLRVVDTLPVEPGMHPHHISVAPDRRRVLITATSVDLSMGHGPAHGAAARHGAAASTLVYMLDAEKRTLRDVIPVDATAHNAAYTPDESTIVLAMLEHGMVAGYDATSFEEKFSIVGFDRPLEVTPTRSGALLVAESGAGAIAVLDLATRKVTKRFDVGAVPVAAWASGGDDYFVSVEEGMQVRHLVETSADVALDAHVLEPGGMPGQAISSPDGKELWVAIEDRGVVVVFDAATHDELAEIEAGSSPHGIVFDPSGERAFVTDQGSSEMFVIDTADRTVSSRVNVGSKPNGIVWWSRD